MACIFVPILIENVASSGQRMPYLVCVYVEIMIYSAIYHLSIWHNFDSFSWYMVETLLSARTGLYIYTCICNCDHWPLIDCTFNISCIQYYDNMCHPHLPTNSLNRQSTHIHTRTRTSSSRPVLSSSHMDLVTNVCVCVDWGSGCPLRVKGKAGNAVPDKLLQSTQ